MSTPVIKALVEEHIAKSPDARAQDPAIDSKLELGMLLAVRHILTNYDYNLKFIKQIKQDFNV